MSHQTGFAAPQVGMRFLFSSMLILQLLWLTTMWATQATSATHKLVILSFYSLSAGLVVNRLPTAVLEALKRCTGWCRSNRKTALVVMIATVLLFGLLYSSQQRLWPFDEAGLYEASVMVASQGLEGLANRYSDRVWLGPKHPPGAPILYGYSLKILGESLFSARLVSVLFLIGTALITYLTGSRLYNRDTGIIGAVLLLSFPLVFRLGTAAMVEIGLVFFFSVAVYLSLEVSRTDSLWLGLLLILVVLLGCSFKYTMVLVLPVLVSTFLLFRPSWKMVSLFGLSTLVGGLLLLKVLEVYLTSDVIQTQFIQISNLASVVTAGHGKRFILETLLTRLPSSIGIHNVPIVMVSLVVILCRRQRADLLLLAWIVTVSTILFLTFPDHRYFMVTFPALSLVLAEGLKGAVGAPRRILLLSLLLSAGDLYLFVDWHRQTLLF